MLGGFFFGVVEGGEEFENCGEWWELKGSVRMLGVVGVG